MVVCESTDRFPMSDRIESPDPQKSEPPAGEPAGGVFVDTGCLAEHLQPTNHEECSKSGGGVEDRQEAVAPRPSPVGIADS